MDKEIVKIMPDNMGRFFDLYAPDDPAKFDDDIVCRRLQEQCSDELIEVSPFYFIIVLKCRH